ncbi:MAG: NAD(P)H-dependent oxidoreductase [Gaiellales bacterium]
MKSPVATVHRAATGPLVVGIGGSARPQSSGELALRYCLRLAEQVGARTELVTAQALYVPMYDPASEQPDPDVARVIDLVRRADALVIASPAYHAGISGLVKNILDHLEALSQADPPYLDGKIVGCIATSRGAQAGTLTLTALRSVVHALRGWPTPLGVVIDTSVPAFGPDDEPAHEATRNQLHIMTTQMLATTAQRSSQETPLE